ncbi:MAG: tetratricopeptide repeat protein [Proteobacteria bacterium]|nr:tetratricopeptide repeat protein [Burkholderiales bacterium]
MESSEAFYTLRDIEDMLGLGRRIVGNLIAAGFVSPRRGARNEYRFSFQDVVLLRTAYTLRAANIPPRRMLRSLKSLRAKLPTELPLSGLRITAIGNDVAVRDGAAQWEAESGQLLMDFEVASSTKGTVSFLDRHKAPVVGAPSTAAQWFARGEELEGEDKPAAEAAYRRALALAPDHAYAYVNLGAMLCESGRCAEAVSLYDEAIGICPDASLLHFNRAIALEDLHRERIALASYERCLELAPDFADAHYNAARLHEKLGQMQGALRHYSAYRRLQHEL